MNLLYTLALTSVYIYNSLGQYLSVGTDGKPAISDKPVPMEVTNATETPSKDAGRKNFNGTDIKWILKSSADGTYTLGYQDSNAYSTAFVYTQNGAIATSYEEPAATFKPGQWTVSNQPLSQKVVLDEKGKYSHPNFSVRYVDVTLKRTFYADEWNTLCLPFPLSASQIAETWGEGTQLAEFVSMSETRAIFDYCNEIEAGKPCLILPERVNEETQVYKFAGIDANKWAKSDSPEYTVGDIKFVGFYSPTLVKKGSYAFGDVNTLYHLDIDMNANGYRCYLEDITGTRRQLTWGFNDNTTGIDGTFVAPQAPKVGNIYTVNGQLVRRNSTAAGLAPGIYIMNGIKLIVK